MILKPNMAGHPTPRHAARRATGTEDDTSLTAGIRKTPRPTTNYRTPAELSKTKKAGSGAQNHGLSREQPTTEKWQKYQPALTPAHYRRGEKGMAGTLRHGKSGCRNSPAG